MLCFTLNANFHEFRQPEKCLFFTVMLIRVFRSCCRRCLNQTACHLSFLNFLPAVLYKKLNATNCFCFGAFDPGFLTRLHVRHAKTQISLHICWIWSEPWLSTWRCFGSLATHWVPCEAKTDQTAWMHRLILVSAERICILVGNTILWHFCSYLIVVRRP